MNVKQTRIVGFRDFSPLFSDGLFLYLSIVHFDFDFFCVSKPVKVYQKFTKIHVRLD